MFTTLYLIIAGVVIIIGLLGYYANKAFEKYGVIDNEAESRYTPMTEASYTWFYSLMIVFTVLMVIILI